MKVLVLCTTDSMVFNFLIPHIQNMQAKGYTVKIACSVTGDFFLDLRDKYYLDVHEIKFRRSPFSFSNVFAFSQLNRFVKKENFDVIFCHEPVGGAMGRVVGHLNHCKVIYMAHGFHFYKGAPRKMKLFYYIEKFLARWTDILITINKEDYDCSLSFKAKEKVMTSGIGVDTSKFVSSYNKCYIRRELGLADDDIILLSVGELIKRKNHEVVIRALSDIDDKRIHYVIAGDGELFGYLNKMVTSLRLENNVHFLGYRRDVGNLCSSADIFIMPSLQEGLSVALMEAMSCGMPIIASLIRGNVDLIDDGKGGFLVSAKSVDGFVKAIKRLVTDKDIFSKFGSYNRERVKLYDIGNVKLQINSLI